MINYRQVFARRLPFVLCLSNANLMLIYFCKYRNKIFGFYQVTGQKVISELVVMKVICQAELLF